MFGEPRFHTDGDIAAIAFATDGSLFSIDEAGLLRHWAADGRLLARHFLSDLETLWCFSPNATKFLASTATTISFCGTSRPGSLSEPHRTGVRTTEAWITAIMRSAPDGRTIATGHDDGKLRFWDVAARAILGEIQAHPDKPLKKAVSAIAFSPDGQIHRDRR